MPSYSGHILRTLASRPSMAWLEATRFSSGRVWAHGARVSELPRCGREFANKSTFLSALVGVCSHNNDVMMDKLCSIRFSAMRVVLENRLNPQRRSPRTSAVWSRDVRSRAKGECLFGHDRRWITNTSFHGSQATGELSVNLLLWY